MTKKKWFNAFPGLKRSTWPEYIHEKEVRNAHFPFELKWNAKTHILLSPFLFSTFVTRKLVTIFLVVSRSNDNDDDEDDDGSESVVAGLSKALLSSLFSHEKSFWKPLSFVFGLV